MKISFDYENYYEVNFNEGFDEIDGFLETFYEWCDHNNIDIEFNEEGG